MHETVSPWNATNSTDSHSLVTPFAKLEIVNVPALLSDPSSYIFNIEVPSL